MNAYPRPTISGTGNVPDLIPRSCPPPSNRGLILILLLLPQNYSLSQYYFTNSDSVSKKPIIEKTKNDDQNKANV